MLFHLTEVKTDDAKEYGLDQTSRLKVTNSRVSSSEGHLGPNHRARPFRGGCRYAT